MAYYLFRMRFGSGGDDIAPQAWGTGHVGIWQGIWTAQNPPPAGMQAAPVQHFLNLTEEDWALTVFGASIHRGRIAGPVENAPDEFKKDEEPFKWRAVSATRSFPLSALPDPFRLLQTTGRGTLQRLGSHKEPLARMLAEQTEASGVQREFNSLFYSDFKKWIALLGPKGWESLATAYLTLEENYVPTGLTGGGTLPGLDIVGANTVTRERVIAQCKNDRNELAALPEGIARELATFEGRAFLFAFAGCAENDPRVATVTAECIKKWFKEKDNGRAYRELIAPRPT